MKAGASLRCTAGTLATITLPTMVCAPKRTRRTSLAGSPPRDFTFAWKNECISPPTISGACLPSTMLTKFEFGVTLTDKSGFWQAPARRGLDQVAEMVAVHVGEQHRVDLAEARVVGPRTVRPAS